MPKIYLKRKIWPVLAVAIVVPTVLLGTWVWYLSQPPQEVPQVSPGVHACSHCGMLVSDIRFAAAVRPIHGKDISYFDDLGCMFSFLKESEHKTWEGWVYDFESRQPLSLRQARFKKTNHQSPMGSGWIALIPTGKNESVSLEQALK